VNRRSFIAASGVAGAAAGAALVSSPKALAQQPSNPNGYAQVDVLNLMLNIKYLKATLYSYPHPGRRPSRLVLTSPSARAKFSTRQPKARHLQHTSRSPTSSTRCTTTSSNQLISLRAAQEPP